MAFFLAYVMRSDPLLGSIIPYFFVIPYFFGYVSKNWRHNQLCCRLSTRFEGLYNKGGT